MTEEESLMTDDGRWILTPDDGRLMMDDGWMDGWMDGGCMDV